MNKVNSRRENDVVSHKESKVFSHIKMNRLLCGTIALSATVMISACGGGTKNTSTSTVTTEDGSETVTVEQTPDGKVTTTTTKKVFESKDGDESVESQTVNVDSEQGQIHVEQGKGAKVHIRMPGVNIDTDEDGNVTSSDVNVNAPGVRVKSNESSGDANIDVPFVNIQKDGKSGKVHIKAPFVDIHADDKD